MWQGGTWPGWTLRSHVLKNASVTKKRRWWCVYLSLARSLLLLSLCEGICAKISMEYTAPIVFFCGSPSHQTFPTQRKKNNRKGKLLAPQLRPWMRRREQRHRREPADPLRFISRHLIGLMIRYTTFLFLSNSVLRCISPKPQRFKADLHRLVFSLLAGWPPAI